MNAPLSPKARDAYRLWQLCFGDTDAFLSSYFSEVYRDDSTLVGYTEGVATTHLQYLPVELSSGGERLPVSYVVAVCTHPDYAGRGLMKEELKTALTYRKSGAMSLHFSCLLRIGSSTTIRERWAMLPFLSP